MLVYGSYNLYLNMSSNYNTYILRYEKFDIF